MLFIQQEVAVETFSTFRKSEREKYDHISKFLYFTNQLYFSEITFRTVAKAASPAKFTLQNLVTTQVCGKSGQQTSHFENIFQILSSTYKESLKNELEIWGSCWHCVWLKNGVYVI